MSTTLYLVNPVLLVLCGWGIFQQRSLDPIRKHVLPALGLKLLAGILLGLLYQYYYQAGDTLTFQNASLVLTNYARQNPEGYAELMLFNVFESEAFRATVPFSRLPNFSNSFYFVKLLSLLNLLTDGHYYLNSLYLSLFSFWGTATLASKLATSFPKYKSAAVLAFLYFPSVVFWSSGVLKDAILFGCICWCVAVAVALAEGSGLSKYKWLLLPFMVYLFIRIKFFLALILLPILAFYILIRLISCKTAYLKQVRGQVLVLLSGVGVVGVVGLFLVLNHNSAFFLRNLVFTYDYLLAMSQERPHIQLENLQPTVASIAVNAPEALFSAIYRPLLWEAANVFYLLLSLENLFILFLSLLAMYGLFKNGLRDVKLLQVCLLLLIIAFGVIIGLTTPNFGTLSRYRVAFLPFLVYLLLQNKYAAELLTKMRL